jgi:hypothetical protein
MINGAVADVKMGQDLVNNSSLSLTVIHMYY